MRAVFADTNYWVALEHPGEELHAKARAVSSKLGLCQIVTSEWVLVELLNYFARRGRWHRETAAKLCDGLHQNPQVEVIRTASVDFSDALALFRQHTDKSWSMVDCYSMLTMQQHGLTEALTYDHHFEQMGFVALLRQ